MFLVKTFDFNIREKIKFRIIKSDEELTLNTSEVKILESVFKSK